MFFKATFGNDETVLIEANDLADARFKAIGTPLGRRCLGRAALAALTNALSFQSKGIEMIVEEAKPEIFLVRKNCEYSMEVTAFGADDAVKIATMAALDDWETAWSTIEVEATNESPD